MKTTTRIVVGILLCVGIGSINATLLYGQQQSVKVQRVVLKKINGETEKGFLYAMDESSITLAEKKGHQYQVTDTIQQKEILKIKIRRKGSILGGAVLGTAGGALAGAVLGMSTSAGKECEGGLFSPIGECVERDRGPQALGYAIIFGVLGGGTGAIIGSGNKKYRINGQPSAFMNFRKEWESFTLQSQN